MLYRGGRWAGVGPRLAEAQLGDYVYRKWEILRWRTLNGLREAQAWHKSPTSVGRRWIVAVARERSTRGDQRVSTRYTDAAKSL
jgi:hypothetical protein